MKFHIAAKEAVAQLTKSDLFYSLSLWERVRVREKCYFRELFPIYSSMNKHFHPHPCPLPKGEGDLRQRL